MKWFSKNSTSDLEERINTLELRMNDTLYRVKSLEDARLAHLEIMKNQSKQLLILSELIFKNVTPPKLSKDK